MKKSLLLIFILYLSTCAMATTWYVDDDAPNDIAAGDPNISDPLENGTAAHPFDAIQEAIIAAGAGDTVLVADGTYTGYGNRDIDFLGKPITVQSQNGPQTCTIDCQGTEENPHRAFIFHSGETHDSILDGFTITGGYAPTITQEFYGDIVEVSGNGGAISCVDSAVTIQNCWFIKNTAYNIFTVQGISNSSGVGGAILCDNSSLILDQCFLENCKAALGGGVFLQDSVMQVFNCIFTGNNSYYEGQAIKVSGSQCSITQSTFHGNSWFSTTQGILRHGPAIVSDSYDGSTPSVIDIHNSILWDELPIENNDGSTIEVRYSCIKDGYPGEGNTDQNPHFVEPGYLDDNQTPYDIEDDIWCSGKDYRLKNQTWILANSNPWFTQWVYLEHNPCVDSGDPLFSCPTDYAGVSRPIDGDSNGLAVSDMGAYEFDPNSIPWIATSIDSIVLEAREDEKIQIVNGIWMWPPMAYLSIHTGNTEPLSWEIVNEPNWIIISQTNGVSLIDANSVWVSADIEGLEVGTHKASFEIVNTADIFQRKTIDVELVVRSVELRVPENYATIQEAIDWSRPGETVILSDGIYTGRSNTNIELPTRDLTIRSENGPDNCIIDCQGDGVYDRNRAFIYDSSYIGTPDDISLSGLKIINGSSYSSEGGGAILCDGMSLTVENCIFENCFARYHGGAIACYDSSPIVNNCTFENCSTEGNGGAIACSESPIVIQNSRFYGNTAYFGSAVTNFSGPFTMNNCKIIGNRTQDWGCSYYPGTDYTIRFNGGAVCYYSSYNENIVSNMSNCLFEGNYGRFCGAFLNIYFGDTNLTNCTFADNSSDEQYNSSVAYVSLGDDPLLNRDSEFNNCIFYGNRNGNGLEVFDGDGYYHYYPEQLLAEDVYSINYSCVEGLSSGHTWFGNINTDPLFVQAGHWDDNGTPEPGYEYDDFWIPGDYHLKSEGWRWDVAAGQWAWDEVTSPCIDAGNPGMALADEPTTLDVDPLNRFGENIRINMGAYGGTAEASIAPPGWALLCDLDNSGRVDLADFSPLADTWLQTAADQPADITRNGIVDLEDLIKLTDQWLQATNH